MKKVIDFLKANSLTTIATSHHDKPRVSILEYYMVGDSFMFATEAQSIKGVNLENNKRISVSVFNAPFYVTIDGKVTTPSSSEIEQYNNQLFKKHPEFKEMMGSMHPFEYFKLIPETAYFSDLTKGMIPAEIIHA